MPVPPATATRTSTPTLTATAIPTATSGATSVPTATATLRPTATLQPTVTPTATEVPVEIGELEVRVTDAPPEGVSNILVTISNIEVHKAGSDEEEGWTTVIEEEKTFDLVEIEGLEEVLGTNELAAGKHTQIRMDVVNVDVTLKPSGEQDFVTRTAQVPSGKLNPNPPKDGV